MKGDFVIYFWRFYLGIGVPKFEKQTFKCFKK